MFYPSKPYYVISGFLPPFKNSGSAAYGFSVGLLGSFAKKAYEFKLSEKADDVMSQIGTKIIEGEFGYAMFPPYGFSYTGTFRERDYNILLHYCRVSGSACDLGYSDTKIENLGDDELLGYYPHNVDNMNQAYTLLSLWLKWFDSAYAQICDAIGNLL